MANRFAMLKPDGRLIADNNALSLYLLQMGHSGIPEKTFSTGVAVGTPGGSAWIPHTPALDLASLMNPYFAQARARLLPSCEDIGVVGLSVKVPTRNTTYRQPILAYNNVRLIGCSSTDYHYWISKDHGETWKGVLDTETAGAGWASITGVGGFADHFVKLPDWPLAGIYNFLVGVTELGGGASHTVYSVNGGATWSNQGSCPHSPFANSLCFDGTRFVFSATGLTTGHVKECTDFSSWTSRACFVTGTTNVCYNTAHNGTNLFMALGVNITGGVRTVRAATSADGLTWAETGSLFTAANSSEETCDRLVFGNGVWLATFKSNNSLYWTSVDDGATWTSTAPPGGTPSAAMNVNFQEGVFSCVGDGGATAWESTDGVTWTEIAEAFPAMTGATVLGSTTLAINTIQKINGEWIGMGATNGPWKVYAPPAADDLRLDSGIDVKVVEDTNVFLQAMSRCGNNQGLIPVTLGKLSI